MIISIYIIVIFSSDQSKCKLVELGNGGADFCITERLFMHTGLAPMAYILYALMIPTLPSVIKLHALLSYILLEKRKEKAGQVNVVSPRFLDRQR